MPGQPLRADQNRDTLIAVARADGFEAELDQAVFKLGWENVVLDTPDGWILRFPRDENVPFERELVLLDRLHDRLPAPIPKIIHTSRSARYAAYRRLDGVHLEVGRFEGADQRTRDRIAGDLGRFLAAMHHALTAEEINAIGVPVNGAEDPAGVEEALPADLRPKYLAVQEEFDQRLAASVQPPVLLHNDFHLGNLVLDGELGRLAGVWDFSCVALGEPSLDFRYLVGDSDDLAARIASAYAARTGREIDLGLAALALTLEDVSDALEEGRDPAPYLR